jgi:hypothetical protein
LVRKKPTLSGGRLELVDGFYQFNGGSQCNWGGDERKAKSGAQYHFG